LVREAQALARLAHPNVVTVHDVGTVGRRVWVAMEYVEGLTLRDWLAERPRGWREVVEVMRDAGKGLAAAHEKGLIHRDFKPDNVMVGDDQRVRVMDFGLARGDEGGSAPQPVAPRRSPANVLDSELTVAGSVMGTPAYMSPEQHLGVSVDAASDQFSFCVTMWEALYGERPFEGSSMATLALAVLEGDRRVSPRDRKVPAALRKLLDRGLATDPSARFADMSALLIALDVDPNRNWRIAGVASVAVLGGALGLAAVFGRPPDAGVAAPPLCQDMQAHMDEVWSAQRKQSVRAALAAVPVGYAEATADRSIQGLDAYATQWVQGRRDACEATRVRGDQSEQLMDRRMACLDEQLEHFKTTVEVLGRADEKIVAEAMRAVLELPRVDACADLDALLEQASDPTDPVTAKAVEQVRATLAQVEALQATAQFDEALQRAQAAVASSQALDFPPILDRANISLGTALGRNGKYDESDAPLRSAYYSALGRGDLQAAQRAASQLANLCMRTAKPDEGR
jgi:hypothetical protein